MDMTRNEAFAWMVDDYLRVYEPPEAIKQTKWMEEWLTKEGRTLADYVQGQRQLEAERLEFDRLNPVPVSEWAIELREKNRITLERRRAELRRILAEQVG